MGGSRLNAMIPEKVFGGVLMQESEPIAYFGEKLSGAAVNYPVYDKELHCQ